MAAFNFNLSDSSKFNTIPIIPDEEIIWGFSNKSNKLKSKKIIPKLSYWRRYDR